MEVELISILDVLIGCIIAIIVGTISGVISIVIGEWLWQ